MPHPNGLASKVGTAATFCSNSSILWVERYRQRATACHAGGFRILVGRPPSLSLRGAEHQVYHLHIMSPHCQSTSQGSACRLAVSVWESMTGVGVTMASRTFWASWNLCTWGGLWWLTGWMARLMAWNNMKAMTQLSMMLKCSFDFLVPWRECFVFVWGTCFCDLIHFFWVTLCNRMSMNIIDECGIMRN